MSLPQFDLQISLFLQQYDSAAWHFLSSLYSQIWFMGLMLSLVLVLIYFKNRQSLKPILIQIFVGFGLHYLITELVIKNFFFRERPFLKYPDIIKQYGGFFQDSSFPSSHLVITTLFTLIIIRFFPRQKYFGATIIVLMLLSRIYNGMHFFSDTLTGIFLGIMYYLFIKISRLARP